MKVCGPLLVREGPEPAPVPGIAEHEAGHCVLALAIGGSCSGATIRGQPHATTAVRGPVNRIAVALAGDHAQRWRLRHVYRPHDDELAPIQRRIACGGGGGCDQCKALRLADLLAPSGDVDAALAVYRGIEAKVIDIITDRRVWAAIRAVAAILEERGEITGSEVHEIADRHGIAGKFTINRSE